MDRKRRPDGEHEKGAAGIGRDVTKEESEDEEEDEDEDEEGEYDEDGIEDSIFIPMTWAKEQPREYYKGSDPEWREFMKFARDGKRQTGAREQLVSRVRTEVSRHPLLKRTLGQIDDRWNNYWIHFYYPPGPPPQYERSGIEVIFLEDDDVVIAWSTRAVELKDQRRLETFLYPTGAMNAFYIIGSSLTKKYWMQFKGVFGNKPPPDASMSTLDQGLQELKRIDGRIAGSGDAPAEQSPGQSPGQPAGKSPGQPPGALVPPNVDGPSIPRQQAVPLFSTFARHFVEGTRAPRSEAPRGTVVLRGTVEVVGNKSVVISQVIGVYDPKQNNLRSVNIKIQDIRPRSLRPRGGP
ncbi:hypothetical protein EJ05DRAFT_521069 [Pseudovirgaria hyperparasitica]|uniref:Uncharacterized protein n=1 Tax=Pseudovirgaria hyperparasitica TaxID=470096 RepID=A0A6A6VXG5_9PEZI|nr:uncharacterized protein EJ05DRAFT_521069 [Pseudovirgaria hyperparasitica]KAF2754320.1 hypothetical protein EJ05DRAFT_521069 [Pseudovirgaria hyperparasitica]